MVSSWICSIPLRGTKKHMTKHGLSEDLKSIILEKHNELRANVTTEGKRGLPLHWDEGLADKAAVVLNYFEKDCRIPKDEKKHLDSKTVGVNTFAIRNCSQCGWDKVIGSWTAEKGQPCDMAHRLTILNPEAKGVGCAMSEEERCQKNVCVYDVMGKTSVASIQLKSSLSCPVGWGISLPSPNDSPCPQPFSGSRK